MSLETPANIGDVVKLIKEYIQKEKLNWTGNPTTIRGEYVYYKLISMNF